LNFLILHVKVMHMNKTTTCPGCGLILPSTEEQFEERYYASSACRQLCYELSAYTLSLGDAEFIHQHVVDTYAAQHAGANMKPIGITFSLLGLYLAHEYGYTGRQVQKAHMLLAKASKQWPQFRQPEEKASLTVQDVLNAPDERRNEMIRAWGKAVWRIWTPARPQIVALVREYLSI
jgi:hypothetical protein